MTRAISQSARCYTRPYQRQSAIPPRIPPQTDPNQAKPYKDSVPPTRIRRRKETRSFFCSDCDYRCIGDVGCRATGGIGDSFVFCSAPQDFVVLGVFCARAFLLGRLIYYIIRQTGRANLKLRRLWPLPATPAVVRPVLALCSMLYRTPLTANGLWAVWFLSSYTLHVRQCTMYHARCTRDARRAYRYLEHRSIWNSGSGSPHTHTWA